MASEVRGVRASSEEWFRWQEAAGTHSLNSWVRATLNTMAAMVEAERRRAADAQAERERLKAAMRG